MGGTLVITADHGNAETMRDPETGEPHTAHTLNPVPFIVVSEDAERFSLRPEGSLQDISPTVLGMLGFQQPADMTGHDLRVAKSS
jgi:2,3-bisphosphoglycerate-independent phosphoglycerate mutase